MRLPSIEGALRAQMRLKNGVANALSIFRALFKEFQAEVFNKREDLQQVRSFKIRVHTTKLWH